MSYPLSFRKKVLSEWQSGTPVKDLIARYKISTSTLYGWKDRVEPKTKWHKLPSKITDELLLDDLKTYPDAYQHERAFRLNCSQAGINKALKRLNISRKKSTPAPESE